MADKNTSPPGRPQRRGSLGAPRLKGNVTVIPAWQNRDDCAAFRFLRCRLDALEGLLRSAGINVITLIGGDKIFLLYGVCHGDAQKKGKSRFYDSTGERCFFHKTNGDDDFLF